ncbi:Fic family protein [Dolosigranulum savutiense]|uniref:Fic family protein n=1 Tax=Dolosigranulum savutiense TaxID=3110288 RepID=A0AB74U1X7_9LACT
MYQSLVIYGYQHAKDLLNEYKRRFESPSAFHTNLEMMPFSQKKGIKLTDHHYELFGVAIPEHVKLVEIIGQQSQKIQEIVSELPKSALVFLNRKQIINEIKSTNDIEGVRSTKKEIGEAIDAEHSHKNVRFKHIVNSYQSIVSSKPCIKELEDIRQIYDKVVAEEIEEENQLDGTYFRNSSVKIFDQRQDQIVHKGTVSEAQIQKELLNLIHFMNNDELSFMYKAIMTHYYFEYIHPFYDGNGRVGRFILSSYLAYKLDYFTAISISSAIYENKAIYEEAFIDVSHKNNFGDLTLFIHTILDIIAKGQKKSLEEMKTSRLKMEYLEKYTQSLDLTEDQQRILYLICEHDTFALPEEPIENRTIKEVLGAGFSRKRVNQVLNELEELSYVTKVKQRPTAYQLSGEKIEDLQ